MSSVNCSRFYINVVDCVVSNLSIHRAESRENQPHASGSVAISVCGMVSRTSAVVEPSRAFIRLLGVYRRRRRSRTPSSVLHAHGRSSAETPGQGFEPRSDVLTALRATSLIQIPANASLPAYQKRRDRDLNRTQTVLLAHSVRCAGCGCEGSNLRTFCTLTVVRRQERRDRDLNPGSTMEHAFQACALPLGHPGSVVATPLVV